MIRKKTKPLSGSAPSSWQPESGTGNTNETEGTATTSGSDKKSPSGAVPTAVKKTHDASTSITSGEKQSASATSSVKAGDGSKQKLQTASSSVPTVIGSDTQVFDAPPAQSTPAVILTPKEEVFCQEYLIDLNATQAAIRAGYSEPSARQLGYQLLTKLHIKNRIDELQKARAQQLGITSEKVLAELAKLGFSNMKNYMQVDSEGYPHLNFSTLTDDQAAALTEITVDEYVEPGMEVDPDAEEGEGSGAIAVNRRVKKVKFKLADKRAALVDIGRHIGMFGKQEAEEQAAATRLYAELLSGFLRLASAKPANAIEV